MQKSYEKYTQLFSDLKHVDLSTFYLLKMQIIKST